MNPLPRFGPQARGYATRMVQWDPARTTLKHAAHHYARARGLLLSMTGRVPDIANVYSASSPKAGSQWMKALFDHAVVRHHSHLFTLPQLDFQSHPEKGFPLGTFVPGLYLSYGEYLRIPHDHAHRVVYMFRDPRDIVVSGYFSAIGGHRRMPSQEGFRRQLRMMPQDEGLLYAVELAASRLREMATWVGVENPDVATFRLEDVSSNPEVEVPRILLHCGVELDTGELTTVLTDVSRESLQAKDLAEHRSGHESHYRVRQQTFRDLFTPAHHQAVEAVVPGLAERLGYAD